MSEGPTTVGSINAYLELNIDRFLAKAAEAQAIADGLERKPIHARVEADTSKAVSGLKDVEAGAKKAEAATAKVEAATKKAATAQEHFGNASKQAMAGLVGGLVAISSAAPPVAAAAVGLTGAFGLMGAAGMVGLSGIVRGLKENNAVGLQYRGTVNSLADSWHSLQDSAAKGLFPGVQASATQLKGDMPVLNGMVQHFAGLLGADLPVGLDAVVTLLVRATPLFDASAGYIDRMVQGLDTWAHGSGYQDFLDYSLKSLPQVMTFLGDVVHFAGDFLTAWAPVGSQTLPILANIVTGLDDIVSHTGSLVPAIVVGVGAFTMLRPVVTIIKGVTAALREMAAAEVVAGAAGGGLGKVGAVGGLTRVGSFGKAAGLGAPMALDGTTLGIGSAGLGISAGVGFGALAGLGFGSLALANALAPRVATRQQFSTGSVAQDIAYFNRPEQSRGRGGQNAQGSASALHTFAQNGGQGGFVNGFAGFFGGQTGTMVNNLDGALTSMVKSGNAQKAAAIIKQLGVSAQDAAVDFPGYIAAVKNADQANATGATSAKNATVAYQQEAAAIAKAATNFQSQDSTANAAKDAVDSVTASVKANGTSLDENTVKGRANAEAVSSAVVAIQAHGAAMVKAGHSTAEASVANDQMAISLEHTLESMGVSKKAATDYINKLMGIPKNRTTEAQLKIDKARVAAEQAKRFADDYAKGKYQAILHGDFTPAQKAAAKAAQAAKDFMDGNYKAALKADPSLAKSNINQVIKNAQQFGGMRPNPKLNADPSGALSGVRRAQGAINGLSGKTVSILAQVKYYDPGHSFYGGGNIYTGPKIGGTIDRSARHGFRPGLAAGGTGDYGTIRGAGTSNADLAGLYRLANGEEVVSNMFGQADKWRPLLKAINAGRVDQRTFEAVGQRAGWRGQQAQRVTTIAPSIHVHNPVAVDPVQQATEATQYALAYAGLG